MFFPQTRSEGDTDTVQFFPHKIAFPKLTANKFLRQSAADIIRILTAPPSSTTLSLQAGDETRNSLLQLTELLNRTEKTPKLITSTESATPQRV